MVDVHIFRIKTVKSLSMQSTQASEMFLKLDLPLTKLNKYDSCTSPQLFSWVLYLFCHQNSVNWLLAYTFTRAYLVHSLLHNFHSLRMGRHMEHRCNLDLGWCKYVCDFSPHHHIR